MFITFDPKKMMAILNCGLTEDYTPDEKTAEIEEKIADLRAKMIEFNKNVVDPSLNEINNLVREYNKPFTGNPDES